MLACPPAGSIELQGMVSSDFRGQCCGTAHLLASAQVTDDCSIALSDSVEVGAQAGDACVAEALKTEDHVRGPWEAGIKVGPTVRSMVSPRRNRRELPKSLILTRASAVSRMLSGFRSPCTTWFTCR